MSDTDFPHSLCLKNSGPTCNLKQGATVKRVIVKCPTKHTNKQNKKIPCALVRLCVFSCPHCPLALSSPQLYYPLTRYFTVCRWPDLLSVWLNMCVYFCQGYYSQFTLKFKSPHIWGQLWSKRLHLSIMSILYLHLCHFIITLLQRRQRSWWKCIWAINATILSNGGVGHLFWNPSDFQTNSINVRQSQKLVVVCKVRIVEVRVERRVTQNPTDREASRIARRS